MKKLIILFLLAVISCKLLAIEKPPYKPPLITSRYVLVTGNVLRMRVEANLKSRILGKLYLGQKVKLLSRSRKDTINKLEDYWYKIKIKNKTGYVFGQYLIPFQRVKILIAEKVGKILIINRKRKIKTLFYKSFYKRHQHLKKNWLKLNFPIRIDYDVPDIIDDKIIIIKRITGFFHGDGFTEHLVLYNNFGKRFAYFKGRLEIKYSKKLKILICNPQKRLAIYEIQPTNKVYFYNSYGKLLRKMKAKLKFKKENKYYSKMNINKTEDKLIWLDNNTRCTIDLKSFNVTYFKYEIDLDARNK